MRVAHDAHVMPVTSRSSTSTDGTLSRRSGDVVSGFIDRRHDVVAVECLAANRDHFGLEVDVDRTDTGNGTDLVLDRRLAVPTAHAGHREHELLELAHDRTSRSIARLASVMIRSDSARSSDCTALATQWRR